ncbi:SDR family oxidoreductase [Pantoea sp. Acro-805]|uniref:SDR family oxidoreductase n=1 Tax=Candidatus Pantoea formicae TaxID=2608355 RepID=A0ABX0QUT3_9GAMM|nr:SDR family NAD(P)-dependent oxidoreductase [Pantoea formicae]MDF7651461.1 SDR family NAD(P)-dependent oxidoreductase [Erwiniaceae bacterium L1_54_3]NIF00793.1 SDR family oxidoreductase [Pantoea formicae]
MLMQGKTVLITGCRRGIGKAIVETFAAHGADIYAHARCEDKTFMAEMEFLSQKYSVDILPVFFDLTDKTAMQSAVRKIIAQNTPIDAVINNAGVAENSLFQMTSETQLRNQFEVNFFSVYFFCQYMVKIMLKNKKGSLINIASTAAEDGNPGKSAYGASKAALVAMTQSIASEMGHCGIRANVISPGITDTDMLQTMQANVVEDAINKTSLKRAGRPSEVADLALYLASDLSGYITGQVIRVDGGLK